MYFASACSWNGRIDIRVQAGPGATQNLHDSEVRGRRNAVESDARCDRFDGFANGRSADARQSRGAARRYSASVRLRE